MDSIMMVIRRNIGQWHALNWIVMDVDDDGYSLVMDRR